MFLLLSMFLMHMMHRQIHRWNYTCNYTILFHSSFCVLNFTLPTCRPKILPKVPTPRKRLNRPSLLWALSHLTIDWQYVTICDETDVNKYKYWPLGLGPPTAGLGPPPERAGQLQVLTRDFYRCGGGGRQKFSALTFNFRETWGLVWKG